MPRRYAMADVFASNTPGGNPVAVVFDATGLTGEQMQALTVEFDYVETSFVLPPEDPANAMRLRIFNPVRELPFSGSSSLGAAVLTARERMLAGGQPVGRFAIEQLAGVVTVDLAFDDGWPVGADLLSPQPLTRYVRADAERAAACLGLSAAEVRTQVHGPEVVSVGLPFLVLELTSRAALRRIRPDPRAFDRLLPLDGARAIYAYTFDDDGSQGPHSRLFNSNMVEDPATGSAAAALTALLATLRRTEVRLRVHQGEDMGRPSTLVTRSVREGPSTRVRVGGRCKVNRRGTLDPVSAAKPG